MRKRLSVLALLLLSALVYAGCGSKQAEAPVEEAPASVTETEASATPKPELEE